MRKWFPLIFACLIFSISCKKDKGSSGGGEIAEEPQNNSPIENVIFQRIPIGAEVLAPAQVGCSLNEEDIELPELGDAQPIAASRVQIVCSGDTSDSNITIGARLSIDLSESQASNFDNIGVLARENGQSSFFSVNDNQVSLEAGNILQFTIYDLLDFEVVVVIDATQLPDNSPPFGFGFSFPNEFLLKTQIRVAFSGGVDDTTDPDDLEYRIVYSNSNNIQSLQDAESNGTELITWTKGSGFANHQGLSSGNTFYYGMMVRDASGKIGYSYTSASTVAFCGGGDGSTPVTAYEICTLPELNAMRDELDKFYKLAANIEAGETRNWDGGRGWNPIGRDVAGDNSDNFTGGFDGSHYKIYDLFIDRGDEEHVGFFGFVDTTTSEEIKNIGLVNVNITGQDRTGSLAGYIQDADVDYSFATGTISGRNFVGGLVGEHDANMSFSFADVDVTSEGQAGGLIGNWEEVGGAQHTLTKSYATGNLTATNGNIGGLVGTCDEIVEYSYATGNVIAGDNRNGGLVGQIWNGDGDANDCVVSYSFASGNVYGVSRHNGGFAGQITNNTSITHSVATGHVYGDDIYGGGFVGLADVGSAISYSLSTGQNTSTAGNQGSFIGTDNGTLNSVYALDRSGLNCDFDNGAANCNHVTTGSQKPFAFRFSPELEYVQQKYLEAPSVTLRKISALDQRQYKLWGSCTSHNATINISASDGSNTVNDTTTCLAFSWELEADLSSLNDGAVTITADQAGSFTKILNLTKSTSYCNDPSRNGTSFANDNESGIDGTTPAKAYAICTTAHFDNLRNFLAQDTNFRLENNIDLTRGFSGPIGDDSVGDCTAHWCGDLDGNGHIISNAIIVDSVTTQYIGIFGFTGLNFEFNEIKNIGFENIHVIGNDYIGTIYGRGIGTALTNVYTQGHVLGVQGVGGAAGWPGGSATIQADYTSVHANVHVVGEIWAGGIFGYFQEDELIDSKSMGHVIAYQVGGTTSGGLAGNVVGLTDIRTSVSEGHVISSGDTVGGLVGGTLLVNTSQFTNNYASGSVITSGQTSGGLFGEFLSNTGTTSILSSYSQGHVITDNATNTGGFVGEVRLNATNQARIEDSFTVGAMSAASAASSGGFVGSIESAFGINVNTNYWAHAETINDCDGTSSPTGWSCNSDGGVTYSSFSEFTDQTPKSIYSNWDFSGTGEWKWPSSTGLPLLRWQIEP